MGSTNHGTQSITWGYFLEASAVNFGKRLMDVVPAGIYGGGYLAKVTDSRVSLSALVAELQDGVAQINVRTAVVATLDSTTLDSGAISSATPYLVMRWAYVALVANYVEIHAIASLDARQQHDVVIGKCVFSGSTLSSFDYDDRTFPLIQERNLQVVATPDTEMYVQLHGGNFNTGNALLKIGDEKIGPFTVPGSGLSRIDIVYIKFDGSIGVVEGTPAVSPTAPSYVGRLVLAEVKCVNGDTNITWDRITDARAFLNPPALIDETSLGINSSGRMYVIRDNEVPAWDISVMDANSLTLPNEFTSTIATFKDPSFGSICKSQTGFSDYWMYNNSVRFRMGLNVVSPITKTLKLFACDNWVYIYIDSVLVYSNVGAFYNSSTPLNVNLVLTAGNHTVDVVFADQGGNAYLNLVGDIVDNSSVYYRAL